MIHHAHVVLSGLRWQYLGITHVLAVLGHHTGLTSDFVLSNCVSCSSELSHPWMGWEQVGEEWAWH